MITVVLRVAASRDGLRGTATHVASGETRAFAGQADLWTFLEEWAAVDGIGAFTAEWTHGPGKSGANPGSRSGSELPPSAPGMP
jgi:hypothetical protein